MIYSDSIIKTNNYLKEYSTVHKDNQIGLVAEGRVGVSAVTSSTIVTESTEIPIIEGTGEILNDISSTGKRRNWSEKKKMNLELSEIFEYARMKDSTVITQSRLNQLKECGSYLKYAETTEGRKLVEANFCRVRLCPMCQWRRSLKLFSQVSEITDNILQNKKVRFIFVTLTQKNVRGEDLSSTIDKMNEGFKLMVQKNRTFAEIRPLQENLLGYLKAIEITYNIKTRTYHPHIHAIFEVRPSYFGNNYIKQSVWVNLWKRVMKLDYEPLVSIKGIKDNSSRAVAEVAKYPVKLNGIFEIKDRDEQARVLITLKKSLHKRRLLTFGGDFREVKRKLALEDVETMNDLVHLDNENRELNVIAYTLFRYNADFGCYIC